MEGFEHVYTLNTVYLIKTSLFGCFTQRSGLTCVFIFVSHRINLYHPVNQSPFSYILVDKMAKLYPVFSFFESRPGDVRGEGEQRSFDCYKCAIYADNRKMCKVTEFAFLQTGFVYLTFSHERIKSPSIKHMNHVFLLCFILKVFMKCVISTFESQIFMSYRIDGAS